MLSSLSSSRWKYSAGCEETVAYLLAMTIYLGPAGSPSFSLDCITAVVGSLINPRAGPIPTGGHRSLEDTIYIATLFLVDSR